MSYKEKYEKALAKARKILSEHNVAKGAKMLWFEVFPELKENENEDERIINQLREHFDALDDDDFEYKYDWLEKQKSADKVEPKFHKGDFIIANDSSHIYQVVDVKRGIYIIKDLTDDVENHIGIEEAHKSGRLWTIKDAKGGDVLSYVTDEDALWIMIYWSLYEPYEGHVHYHALLVNDKFWNKGTCCICIDNLKPSTKEQRDLLFQKMKEAGYEWDADKKELKKIEQKPVWSEEGKDTGRLLSLF